MVYHGIKSMPKDLYCSHLNCIKSLLSHKWNKNNQITVKQNDNKLQKKNTKISQWFYNYFIAKLRSTIFPFFQATLTLFKFMFLF